MPGNLELADIAAAAAKAVGDDLRIAFGRIERIGTKANFHDLVTDDVATEATIRAHPLAVTPDAAVGGEGLGAAGDGNLRWYVDPIGCTNNFAGGGIPFFCVSIGAAIDGSLLAAGAIFDPIHEELFTSSADGALCNGELLSTRGARVDSDATIVTGFPRHESWMRSPGRPLDSDRFVEMVLSFRTVGRLGAAALALAFPAAGRADVVFGVNAKSWDLAAGAMLVTAADGALRPVKQTATGPAERPTWASPTCLAHVADFDPNRGCISDIAAACAL